MADEYRMERARREGVRQLRRGSAMITRRCILVTVGAALLTAPAVRGQEVPTTGPSAARYMAEPTGMTLEAAISRALEHEPSLRAVRADVAVAQGLRQQAALRPNPTLVLRTPGGAGGNRQSNDDQRRMAARSVPQGRTGADRRSRTGGHPVRGVRSGARTGRGCADCSTAPQSQRCAIW